MTLLTLLSFVLTYLVRQLALRENIIDNPSEQFTYYTNSTRWRISHYNCLDFRFMLLFWKGQIEKDFFLALLSGSVLAVVSALDDVLDLTLKFRIATQISAFRCL